MVIHAPSLEFLNSSSEASLVLSGSSLWRAQPRPHVGATAVACSPTTDEGSPICLQENQLPALRPPGRHQTAKPCSNPPRSPTHTTKRTALACTTARFTYMTGNKRLRRLCTACSYVQVVPPSRWGQKSQSGGSNKPSVTVTVPQPST